MTTRRPPAPPQSLQEPGRALWKSVVREYVLEPHHLAVLEQACNARDRVNEAQAAISEQGSYIVGRFGPKAHPALAVETANRTLMARLLRELGLDLEAPATSRPPTRWR